MGSVFQMVFKFLIIFFMFLILVQVRKVEKEQFPINVWQGGNFCK